MHDYEPSFYPCEQGTFAMAEENVPNSASNGICNTESMHRIYTGSYGGKAMGFVPAVGFQLPPPRYGSVRTKGQTEPVTTSPTPADRFPRDPPGSLVYAAAQRGSSVGTATACASWQPELADLPANAQFIDLGPSTTARRVRSTR